MGPAQKTAPASAGAKTYRCPKCGKVFPTRQALGGHLSGSHRLEKSDVETQVDETLRDIAAPVRAQRDEITVRLEALNKERATLAAALTRLDGVLKKLDPAAVTAHSDKGKRAGAGDEERVEAVLAWLEEHAGEHPDGITPSEIGRAMKEADYPGRPGIAKAPAMIAILHSRGIVVADHKTTGGGVAYKLVGRNGNTEDSQ